VRATDPRDKPGGAHDVVEGHDAGRIAASVMPGLGPGIHAFLTTVEEKAWVRATSARMT